MGGVSVAVAQAMRYAGCPNRRSLGIREVFPQLVAVVAGTVWYATGYLYRLYTAAEHSMPSVDRR